MNRTRKLQLKQKEAEFEHSEEHELAYREYCREHGWICPVRFTAMQLNKVSGEEGPLQ